jgi:hypothetical protein
MAVSGEDLYSVWFEPHFEPHKVSLSQVLRSGPGDTNHVGGVRITASGLPVGVLKPELKKVYERHQ